MADYTGIFEPPSEDKQLANSIGTFVTGDAPMGTTDQNAAIDAANKTAGEWDGDAPQDGTDSNDEIEDANMLPGEWDGEVSSDAVNGVDVVLPPNQIIVTDEQDLLVMDASDDPGDGTTATLRVDAEEGSAIVHLPSDAAIITNAGEAIVVTDSSFVSVPGSPGTPEVEDGILGRVVLQVVP